MSMLDVHADALAAINEAHHIFLSRYQKAAKQVYGFIEGREDPMFYRTLLEAAIPSDWDVELFPCGGRDKVFDVYDGLDWSHYSKKRICFFVDRDLSRYLHDIDSAGKENVFVTDGYSIENDLITVGLLNRMISEVLNIQGLENSESEALSAMFEQELDKFKSELVPIMAQILIWRRNGHRANLNNLDLKEFFEFGEGTLRSKYEDKYAFVEAVSRSIGAQHSSKEELNAAEAEFTGEDNYTRYIRGKFLLWFLVKYSLSIHENAPNFCKKLNGPPKIHVQVGPNNVVVYAAPRVRATAALRSFIEANFSQYISSAAA